MKRLYMILAGALTAVCANAQSLHLYVGGEEVTSGSTVDITKYFEEASSQFNPHFEIEGDVSGKFHGEVEYIKIECEPGLDDDWVKGAMMGINWCAFGACTPAMPGSPAVKEGQLTAGTMTEMELEYILTLGDEQKVSELKIDAECRFSCTFDGQEYSLAFVVKQDNSGVEAIMSDNAAIEYYDLQGRRVQNPSRGIYIERQGNRVTKRVVK